VVDLNCGLRDRELRELRWPQIDLVHKKQVTAGKPKTDAGTGCVIPLTPGTPAPEREFASPGPAEWSDTDHAHRGKNARCARAGSSGRYPWMTMRSKLRYLKTRKRSNNPAPATGEVNSPLSGLPAATSAQFSAKLFRTPARAYVPNQNGWLTASG